MIITKKNLIKIFLLFILVFSLSLSAVKPVYAQNTDFANLAINTGKWIWEKVVDVTKLVRNSVSNKLIENTARQFANKLAYDVANSIAAGAEGGKPLFRTESIKKSLQNAQEAALGEFVGDLTSKSFSQLGFNLCDPSLEVKLTLTLNLIDSEAPPAPKCNWRDVQKQWAQFSDQVSSGRWQDFIKIKLDPRYGTAKDWDDFWSQFDDGKNDLTVLSTLREKAAEKKAEAQRVAALTANECQGYLDKKTIVTEEVKTHCSLMLTISTSQWDQAVQADANFVGPMPKEPSALSKILTEAGNTFTRTLSSRLLKFYIEKGMRQIASWYKQDSNFRDDLLARLRGGADLRRVPRGSDVFRDLKTTSFEVVEDFSLTDNFIVCPDQADFRHPDNCVMTPEFLNVLSQKKTIRQAILDGELDGSLPFISAADPRNNSDSCYKEGFCYHNLVKLRKANIIPIGWELAAQSSSGGQAPTLSQVIDCFEDDTCDFNPSAGSHNPYYHLVDPNWVLKVPAARCEAFAYAPTLEANESSSRQQYCADVKTCLLEDDEGNCLDGAYGYCTKSENVWRLNADICEEGDIYAGCLTFDNPDLARASYLEQSLEYCGADGAGCKRYSQEQDENDNWLLQDIASDNNDLFLNKQSSSCSEDYAGCREFIVMAANRSVNIIDNGDFDYNTQGWSLGGANAPEVVNDAFSGQNALEFSQNVAKNVETGYALKERTFILSFYAKAENAGTLLNANLGGELVSTTLVPNWQKVQVRHKFAADINSSLVGLQFTTVGRVIIDAVKLEEVTNSQTEAGNFSGYGDGTRVFMTDEKQMCLAEEVGCQGYYPNNNDPMIPAVVNSGDLCPNECVGYENFAQTPTYFDFSEDIAAETEYYNFIPSTAQSCPSIAIGCEEFTNLEAVEAGGEGKEYFTYLRQCVASATDGVATYYTWEGEDVSGYQLKTWTFLKSNFDSGPCTNIEPGSNSCADDFLNIAACGADTPANPFDDPEYNPNCREFFDTDSNSYFRLQDKVIYASDDCKTYRRSASGQEYQAIANLSYSCQAQYNGCHAYTGNAANNVRRLFLDNFESGTYNPWQSSDISLDLSNQSLANNGHSLKINAGEIKRELANLRNNQSYQLTWWMKNTGNLASIRASLYDDVAETEHLIEEVTAVSAGDWRRYQLSVQAPLALTNIDNIYLKIEFAGAGEIFLDNILLSEVTANLAFIKNSWTTPASCDDPFAGAYLGCQAYTDTNNQEYSFKSFSSLCREDAIGCLAAIDTQNSKSPFSQIFNETDDSEITVAADNIVYLVPEQDKYCPQAYKGCSALGLPIMNRADNQVVAYQTVYKVNDPDKYTQSLCLSEDLYCEAYNSDKGTYYFKDPGNRTCTYKKNVNLGGTLTTGWFKTDTLESANPVLCSPAEQAEWGAACPEEKNLCTEIKDPLDPPNCDVEAEAGSANACESYYYYKNDKIDQGSCNGQFDQNSGCTLLYDANLWNGPHTQVVVNYNASSTYAQNISDGAPVNPISDSDNNANMLVKVRKDRQCSEWLDCKSSSAVFDPSTNTYKNICDAVGTCLEYDNTSSINHCKLWKDELAPADIQPLTLENYKERVTGAGDHLAWSDDDYLGYSIPNLLPIEILSTYNFASDDASVAQADIRLVYQSDSNECTGKPDLGSCSDTVNGFDFDGLCKDNICWLNPYSASAVVPMSLALDTRAYSTVDSPFGAATRSVQNYSAVNVCEDGADACETAYQKITYGAGGFVKYLAKENSAYEGQGVCTVIDDDAPDGVVEGSFCVDDDACGTNGRCSKATRIETYLNWPGICLEEDPSTSVPIDGTSGLTQKRYCNQWYPVDEVAGAQSLYNNFKEAGFYSDSGNDLEMCVLPQDYVTTEDRYYCGATENGLGNDEGVSCTVLFKVSAGSRVVVDQVPSFDSFIYGNYLLPSSFVLETIGSTHPQIVIRRSDADLDACNTENQNDTDRGECISERAFFEASAFGKSSFEGIIISPSDLAELFVGNVEYYYFDEAVKENGTWDLDEGNNGGDNDKVLAIDGRIIDEGDPCTDWDTANCAANEHQVEIRDWRSDSHCGVYGPRKHYGKRYCNPSTYNYYIRAESQEQVCTETNCAAPYGRACLRTKPTYIATPSSSCGTNINCSFKSCVESLTLNTPYCSEYGEINHDMGAVTGCLDYILDLNASGDLTRAAGASESLINEVSTCLFDSAIEETNCAGAEGYETNISLGNCSGFSCFQQCQTISEVAAEGDNDRSWVRTDIWWRYGQNNYTNSTWTARYYSGGVYTNPVVMTSGVLATMNKYFGSANGSDLNRQILTKVPLDNVGTANKAAIFFGTNNTDAYTQMKYLFARLYNLSWNGSIYNPTDYPEIDDGQKVNIVAGDDYAPYIYKVCANNLCTGNDLEGVTINNQQSGDLTAQKSLFTVAQFYYHAHPDHMPLIELSVDWDDGESSENIGKMKNNLPAEYCSQEAYRPGSTTDKMSFGGLARACHGGYKTFYHTYQYNELYPCNGAGKPDIDNASCYKPSVTVKDNWNQSQTVSYDDWIVVYNN